jgi:hypothetical protein
LKRDYCFGAEPFVERLLSFFLLSDEQGKSFNVPVSPDIPLELPLASGPTIK